MRWLYAAILVLATALLRRAEDRHYGQVVSPQGQPVADAQVRLLKHTFPVWETVATTSSDANGRFNLPLPQTKDQQTIVVWAKGYGLTGTEIFANTESKPAQLQLAAATKLAVKFLTPDGKPAVGVAVSPGRAWQSGRWFAILPLELRDELKAICNEQGVCTLADLPQNGQVVLSVGDERFAQLPNNPVIELSAQATNDGGTIQLEPGGSISGKVAYADGKPAADINIFANRDHQDGVYRALTGANGDYQIKQLPPGVYRISVDLMRNDLQKSYTVDSQAAAELAGGAEARDKNFTLIAGATISGKVTAQQGGKPVAGVGIFVIATSPNTMQQATQTGEDGTYLLHVPPGKQSVQLGGDLPPGYQMPRKRVVLAAAGADQTATADFQLLGSPAPIVKGKVVDAAGQPVAGITVFAQHQTYSDDRDEPKATTDSAGQFTLQAIKGSTLHAHKGQRSVAEAVPINNANDEVTLVLRDDVMASALLRVQQADGTPIAGAIVNIYIKHGGTGTGVQNEKSAGTDGTYIAAGLYPDMTYQFSASAKGFSRVWGLFNLQAGKQIEIPPIVLVKAESSIAGLVMDEKGEPVPGCKLFLSGQKTMQQDGSTDEAGHFSFNNIVAGERVSLSPQEHEIVGRQQGIMAGTNDAILVVRPRPAR